MPSPATIPSVSYFVEFYSGFPGTPDAHHCGTRSLRSTIESDAEVEARALLAAAPNVGAVALYSQCGRENYRHEITYIRI